MAERPTPRQRRLPGRAGARPACDDEQLKALDKALGGAAGTSSRPRTARCASDLAPGRLRPRRERGARASVSGLAGRRSAESQSAGAWTCACCAQRARAGTPRPATAAAARFSQARRARRRVARDRRGGALRGPRAARRAWRARRRRCCRSYPLNTAIKLAVRRRRPQLEGLPPLTCDADAAELPERAREHVVRGRARILAPGPAARAAVRAGRRPVAVAACISGVHYPSDVIAGCALGTALAARAPARDRGRAMSTRIGIVGMPNAGKSSLFNALTKAGAEAANYPFTTIEPNVAVVPVRDERLEQVAATVGASEIVWDTIDFHDIAGLVAGAHEGEGLGNRFLANIRETDAIVHVVRAHGDENVVHPEGRVDPLRGHRDDRDRARAGGPRAGRAARRARRQDRPKAATARRSPRRRGCARWSRSCGGAAGAHRAGARGGPERGPRPRLADEQAGAVRGERRRGLGGGAGGSPSTRLRRARGAVAVSSRIESELAELEDEDAARCARSSASASRASSGSCARRSRC